MKPEITKPKDLKGTTLASPSLGNTQDVALRSYLASKGLETDEEGGGDVSIVPQDNALTLEAFQAGLSWQTILNKRDAFRAAFRGFVPQDNALTLQAFHSGDIDGAWVPEPWATRLIDEGGAKVLVDERDLWPNGEYVTTHLIVAKPFLDEHRDVVRNLVKGNVDAIKFIAENPDVAQNLVAKGIENVTGKAVAEELIAKTFKNLTFTNDPIASSLAKSAKDAEDLGLLDPVDLDGIYDLKLLNKILKKAGEPTVTSR